MEFYLLTYHELEHPKMCLDTFTDMNETHTVPGDNSDTDIDLGYERNFHNELSDYVNKDMFMLLFSTLFEKSAVSLITDENAVDYIPKNPSP